MKWFECVNSMYYLHTAHTSYVFRVTSEKQLEHVWYGKRVIATPDAALAAGSAVYRKPSASVIYSKDNPIMTLNAMCGEISGKGKGDFGEPFVELEFMDGSNTTDFVFSSYEVKMERPNIGPLPSAYDADGTLMIHMSSPERPGLYLTLYYSVYSECDVITRSSVIQNNSNEPITIKRIASAQLDFPKSEFIFSAFHGAWADEMHRTDTILSGNNVNNESTVGASSNQSNPFNMLMKPGTTETSGSVYAYNLIYSGNHRTIAQSNTFGRLRWQIGIHPDTFTWLLNSNESFSSPEAMLCFSDYGCRELSRRIHSFVRNHIVRGEWKNKTRPIVMNSWEAFGMKFDEEKLLHLAKCGYDCGAELFVLDDGWFGNRNQDNCSLGDWTPSTAKFPEGLPSFAKKLHEIGLSFGLWVEPEMISVNSELYRKHPDWAMAVPNKSHSEGRHQRILDLCNPEVLAYMETILKDLFSSANVQYVKWDMNRLWSDTYSPYLSKTQQKEVNHRYMLGLYTLLDHLVKAFPNILFESCAGGGCRADLGMLCYMPQFWASDNTDAWCRAGIQMGYSYGYPLSVLGCHVSACPNQQTNRTISLWARFGVAMYGILGYELDFTELTEQQRETIKQQIEYYKSNREWLQFADYYRLQNGEDAPAAAGFYIQNSGHLNQPYYEACAISRDKERGLGIRFTSLSRLSPVIPPFFFQELSEDEYYEFSTFYDLEQSSNKVVLSGSLLNYAGAGMPCHTIGDRRERSGDYVLQFFSVIEKEKEKPQKEGL